MRPKHIPLRSCVVCGTKAAKRTLVRVVATTEGACVVDETGKRNGRGAYLCQRRTCWEQAAKGGRLSGALRMELRTEDRERLAVYAAALVPDGPREGVS